MSSSKTQPKARAHFTQEFTPGRTKGIDYMFAGETRRIKKTVAAPASNEAPMTAEDGRRRMRAIVDSAPKDNQQQQWPTRGLKKVDNAPKDNKEAFLFARRTLAAAAVVPPEKKEQQFPKGGKAMVGGRSFTSSGNILAWNTEPMFEAGVRNLKI